MDEPSLFETPDDQPDQGSTRVERFFVGCTSPLIPSLVDHLLDRFSTESWIDLSAIVVVTPGGRASRLLDALLVEQSELRSATLLPPQIVTPASLPEILCTFDRPRATRIQRLLAWASALRSIAPARLDTLLPSLDQSSLDQPAPASNLRFMGRAEQLLSLYDDLSGHGVAVHDVIPRVAALTAGYRGGQRELERWNLIAEVASAANALLDSAGVTDPHSALQRALKQRRFVTKTHVVLAGIAELPGAIRSLLNTVPCTISALVAAPEQWADRFDALGCVLPSAWSDATIDLPDAAILCADSPQDQANAVLGVLTGLTGRYRADEIVIGSPDPEVAQILSSMRAEHGIPTFRDAAGPSLAHSPPVRLIRAVADFLEARSVVPFAELIRHPDLEQWLCRCRDEAGSQGIQEPEPATPPEHAVSYEDWLADFDAYRQDHLPAAIGQDDLHSTPRRTPKVSWLFAQVDSLLSAFTSTERRELSHWTQSLRTMLLAVYNRFQPKHGNAHDDSLLAAVASVGGLLAEIESIPAQLVSAITTTPREALLVVSMWLARETVAPAQRLDAIDVVGWLELAHDPAPVVIVTGCNEGHLPAATAANPLIPDSLRRSLGLPSHEDTSCRDTYLLAVLAASRRQLTLIAGCRSSRGDPLRPSRLLFACESERIPERIRLFLGSKPDRLSTARAEPQPPPSRLTLPITGRAFDAMPRIDSPEVTSMRVTGFRAYLRSPYGFFLEHVLGLAEVADPSAELCPGAFGTLLHDVVLQFARGPTADSQNATKIRGELHWALDHTLAEHFGPTPSPAVLVQAAHARQRLARFAEEQAQHRASGWRILHAEWDPKARPLFSHHDSTMALRGRIDRIDINEATGDLLILDYKTGARHAGADADHRSVDGTWHNLQLPLYRALAAELIRARGLSPDSVSLGYIAIGQSERDISFDIARWSRDELRTADDAAASVIKRVHARDFFRLGTAPPESDILSVLCGTAIHLPPDSQDEETGDDA